MQQRNYRLFNERHSLQFFHYLFHPWGNDSIKLQPWVVTNRQGTQSSHNDNKAFCHSNVTTINKSSVKLVLDHQALLACQGSLVLWNWPQISKWMFATACLWLQIYKVRHFSHPLPTFKLIHTTVGQLTSSNLVGKTSVEISNLGSNLGVIWFH